MKEVRKKQDRRVVRTKRAIRNAFAELLSEKELEKITIKDIADKADINRKTFYNYYNGTTEIIDEIENELVNSFDTAIKSMDLKKEIKNPYMILSKLTAIINKDMDFYGYLFKMHGNVSLASKITDLLKDRVQKVFLSQIKIDEKKLSIMTEYSISGMISVYQNWFNSNRSQTIEEISELVSTLCFKGINGLMEES